ncbi:metallophosphoesterase [Romboutsia lituseburensis]|uniref:metallophosphoesterase n=1 Tax=Romboutsia lituseburensis TaxID=1537 RepID=UPI00215B07A9|nr:metallophosphoesterase [Romboutsia lituseburensis]MCR8746482.1 metallophosphoesterase [Romboutsia lituseburensis]
MLDKVILGGSAILGIAGICLYETNSIEINKYEIKNKKIPKEFHNYKIVQISDLHNKSFGKDNYKLIKKIDALKPDAIFITGDLVEGENKNYKVALDLVDALSLKYPIYHIIGNHEQKSLNKKHRELYKDYFKQLYNKKIINLDNDKITINRGDSYINLYGLVVPLEYYPYFFSNYKNKNKPLGSNFMNDNLGKINDNEYNILLAHNPFFFEEYSKWGADLILSGHVHGGIIRIPYLGGVLSPSREFFPKYDLGEYKENSSTMLLSKGLGGSKVLVRLNCKPEIVQITLKNK